MTMTAVAAATAQNAPRDLERRGEERRRDVVGRGSGLATEEEEEVEEEGEERRERRERRERKTPLSPGPEAERTGPCCL